MWRCVDLLCCQAVACGGGLIAMLPSSCMWRCVDLLCCQAVIFGGGLFYDAAKQLHMAVGCFTTLPSSCIWRWVVLRRCPYVGL
jgi:hypothetical protein